MKPGSPARLTAFPARWLRGAGSVLPTAPNCGGHGTRVLISVLGLCAIAAIPVSGMLWEHASARTYHVDINRGNDTWPGTREKPLKTVTRASQLLVPGDTALIAPGVYHEQVMGGRSGTPDAAIVYEGLSREKVILRGSVRVTDWEKHGRVWLKRGLKPITHQNAFVMIDEKRLLKRVDQPHQLPEGAFHLSAEGTYTIRLWNDEDPVKDHRVEVYELDFAFNSGDEWGGTAKMWIILRNLTMEKYGTYAISTDFTHPADNSHWELDRLTIQYNNEEGVFHCLDDWFVHDCVFVRNSGHGCQLNGARIRFMRNYCAENEWFGVSGDGGCGILIGPDASAHSCVIRNNVFENNGAAEGYGCGIYFEGRSHNNLVEDNLFVGGTTSGIAFFGSSDNRVGNNVFVNIALNTDWDMSAAFAFDHSLEGAPTQSTRNLVAHNTIFGCSAPVAAPEPHRSLESAELNQLVNNLFFRCRFLWPVAKSPVVVMRGNGFYSCPRPGNDMLISCAKWLRTLGRILDHEAFKAFQRENRFGEDPGLVDPCARDFSLKPDSPLIDAGIIIEGFRLDREGNERPFGSAPDIGAYEFIPAVPQN